MTACQANDYMTGEGPYLVPRVGPFGGIDEDTDEFHVRQQRMDTHRHKFVIEVISTLLEQELGRRSVGRREKVHVPAMRRIISIP